MLIKFLKKISCYFKNIDENTEKGKEYLEAIREESLKNLGYFLKPSELFTQISKTR